MSSTLRKKVNSYSLKEETIRKIEELAKKNNCTRSAVIDMLVERYTEGKDDE